MRLYLVCLSCTALLALTAEQPANAQSPEHLHGITQRVYDGPPLSLRSALDDALGRNPSLVVLRRQYDAARQRPGQQ